MIRAVAALLLLLGLCLGGRGVWIHAKAGLAQQLLELAWRRTLAGEPDARPWPWADTRPLARLRAPAHDVDLIVLEGDSGATLAFGPGHAPGSALPGSPGDAILSGHRDTHFRFARELRPGDLLVVTDRTGARTDYRVVETRVVDARHTRLAPGTDGRPRLVLVTCWPFDALQAGGPLRYLVFAESEAHRAPHDPGHRGADGAGLA